MMIFAGIVFANLLNRCKLTTPVVLLGIGVAFPKLAGYISGYRIAAKLTYPATVVGVCAAPPPVPLLGTIPLPFICVLWVVMISIPYEVLEGVGTLALVEPDNTGVKVYMGVLTL
jgi:hypothetical protein